MSGRSHSGLFGIPGIEQARIGKLSNSLDLRNPNGMAEQSLTVSCFHEFGSNKLERCKSENG